MEINEKLNDKLMVKPDLSPQLIGVIDIGSNSIRMVIAQINANNSLEIIEQMQKTVRLGQDTFRFGFIGRMSMQAAILILRDFKKHLDLYKVKNIEVAATSAVREAANSDVFLDRVLIATGLDVRIIDVLEESRLIVSAVMSDMTNHSAILYKNCLIAEVGGGSTIITITQRGQILTSQSLGLGVVRLQEAFESTFRNTDELIENDIANLVSSVESIMPLKKLNNFIAVGPHARFISRNCSQSAYGHNTESVSTTNFEKLLKKICQLNVEQICDNFELPITEAETLIPAMLIYQRLLKSTNAKKLYVSNISIRDGLLNEIVRRQSGKYDIKIEKEITQSAITIAKKYRVDIDQAMSVMEICGKIFDATNQIHGLDYLKKTYLQVAALLYNAGTFISSRAFHKHSFYIISNSEIFGMSKKEVELSAHIARYHRKSRPKPTHIEYMSLPSESRIIVNKLAAILRLADCLEITSSQIKETKFLVEKDIFRIKLPKIDNIANQRKLLKLAGAMFESIFCLQLKIEQG